MASLLKGCRVRAELPPLLTSFNQSSPQHDRGERSLAEELY